MIFTDYDDGYEEDWNEFNLIEGTLFLTLSTLIVWFNWMMLS